MDMLQEQVGMDLDMYDLICHLAFDHKAFTRRQRADKVRSRPEPSSQREPCHQTAGRAYQGAVMDGKVAVEEIKQKFETVGHPVSIHLQKGRSFGASMTDEGAMVDWKWIAGFMLTLISSILGVLSWLSNRKKPAREERPVPSPRERKKQP